MYSEIPKNKYRKRRAWRSLITVLASIMVFVTTYALIIPAITWEQTLICELEEHVHTDNCYNSKGELKCGKEEHKHTDACFDAPKAVLPEYLCGKTEHQHTSECYFANGTLKCTLSEHLHTGACMYSGRTLSAFKTLLSETPNTVIYLSDPDTSDIESWFKENGEYSNSNDGRIAADKTVKIFDPRNNQFEVTLSALSQTYKAELSESETVHPDVVFILDISNSMFTNSVSDGKGGTITRAEAVVNAVNKSIETLLEADPYTRIGIVSYGNECTDDRLYLEVGNYKLNSGSGWLTYDGNYTKASNGTRLLHIPLSEIPNGGKSYPLELFGSIEGYTVTVTPNIRRTSYTITAKKGNTTITWTVSNGSQTSPAKSGLKNIGNYYSAEVVSDGTYLDFYYHYDRTDGPAHAIAVNSNLRNADGTTDGIVYAPFIGIDGTYTQAGIMAAADMLINGAEEKRIPSIILVSDGEPTYAYAYDTTHPETLLEDFNSKKMEEQGRNNASGGYGLPGDNKFGTGTTAYATQAGSAYDQNGNLQGTNTNNSRGALMGYYTVRTAMYVKEAIYEAYYAKFLDYYESLTNDDGQRMFTDEEAKEHTEKALDTMFFSVGPGVTSLYGKTVLGPGNPNSDDDTKTNLEVSQNDNTASFGNVTPARFYEILTTELQKEGKSGLDFVDYADYSIAGNMTAPELDEQMQLIVNRISGVPRPVITSKDTIDYHIINPEAFVTFTDKLGKDMNVTGGFTLTYENQDHTAELVETGVLYDESLYHGCQYERYAFTGYVTEHSTGIIEDLKDIRVYLITDEDGSKVVLWEFPSELLPVIYHKYNFNGAGLVDDEYHSEDPIRLKYNVGVNGNPIPGRTYYSNSTEDIASMSVHLSNDNPYYKSGYNPEEKAKTDNSTGTVSYSFAADKCDKDRLAISLGNNGKLYLPLTLAVHKNWDDTATTHDPITVHLYANGEDTGLTVVLNDSNGWAAKFPGNINAEDQNGDPVRYTVREEVPAGYTVTGENDEPKSFTYEVTTGTAASWTNATTMTAGNTYRIHFSSASGNVLKDNNGSVGVGASSGGATDTSEQWKVVNVGNALRLQNAKSGNYIGIDSSGTLTYSSSYNNTSVSLNNSTIRLRRNYTTRYLQLNNGTLSAVSSNGTTAYIEQLVPGNMVTTEATDFGFDLTNKPLEFSISAEKVWGIGTDGVERSVDLKVYEKKANGTVSEIGTMQLEKDGNWKASFSKSPADQTSTYYVSEINADEFTVSYTGGDVENLTYDGKTFPAVKVDVQHEAKIVVTNALLRGELPATGGSGIIILYVIGAFLMSGALIIGCILWRRREGRGEI